MNFNQLIIADDFGFNRSSDQVMLDLCSLKKIDGVSVFPKYISQDQIDSMLDLRKNRGIKIGLHFNLTLDDDKNSLKSIKQLLIQSLFRPLDKELIAREFDSQLKVFKDKFNCYPDFIDGHEHVHAFPVISKIVCKKLHDIQYTGLVRYIGSRSKDVLIRSIKHGFFLKFITLEILAFGQRKHLIKNNLRFNERFDGLLPSNSSGNLVKILQGIYGSSNLQSTIIMCHPGIIGTGLKSNFFGSKDREIEKNFLNGR
ncbi:ChbG/HpnK family deacetylase [Gammaproteobacteria bacterium]|nr:ChbG/HpnK family deacetylase [Gammaproteobacteria bacterium]